MSKLGKSVLKKVEKPKSWNKIQKLKSKEWLVFCRFNSQDIGDTGSWVRIKSNIPITRKEAEEQAITVKVKILDEVLSPIRIEDAKIVQKPQEYTIERSDIEGHGCPSCGAKEIKGEEFNEDVFKILQPPHKDREGDITHWDAQCRKCAASVTILND